MCLVISVTMYILFAKQVHSAQHESQSIISRAFWSALLHPFDLVTTRMITEVCTGGYNSFFFPVNELLLHYVTMPEMMLVVYCCILGLSTAPPMLNVCWK